MSKFGSSFTVASLALMLSASQVEAQNPTATVTVFDRSANQSFNQVVQCSDYIELNGALYTSNKAAAQVDIGSDVVLDPWELTDIVNMQSLEELSPSWHKVAVDHINQGHSEADVLLWLKSQIPGKITIPRTVRHMSDVHGIPESESTAALKSARDQCAAQLGLQ